MRTVMFVGLLVISALPASAQTCPHDKYLTYDRGHLVCCSHGTNLLYDRRSGRAVFVNTHLLLLQQLKQQAIDGEMRPTFVADGP
jgi:hypothetical protein